MPAMDTGGLLGQRLTVETWPTERVSEYERNPRRHTKRGIAAIAKSIRELGWRQPLAVNPEGVLLIGHGRLRAAVSMGLAEVPVHVPMRRMIGAAGRPPLVVDPEVADRIRAWYARPA